MDRVARRRSHRRGDDDRVETRLAEGRVGAVAVLVGGEHPGVDDVEVTREQLGEAPSHRRALLPEPRRHLRVEEREVAGDHADARAAGRLSSQLTPSSIRALRVASASVTTSISSQRHFDIGTYSTQ